MGAAVEVGRLMKRSVKAAEKVESTPGSSWMPRAVIPLLLVVAGVAAYWTSFAGDFVYDDPVHIHQNERIRDLGSLGTLLGGRRPVVDLTLALNYAAGQLDRWGYHAFNLAVHLLAGLALYGLVRRTLSLEAYRERFASLSRWLAGAVALLWLVHPLQTQSVTYIIQRGESLMGLFYLLTVYCLMRGATGRHPIEWYAIAVATCALGMGSKAVMVTAPLTALLYDRAFLSVSFRAALQRRYPLYIGLVATLGILVVTGVAHGVLDTAQAANRSVGFGFKGITPWAYALTQPGVIVHYLRLSFWPDPLCLDYAWPAAATAGRIVPPLVVVLILVGGTAWSLRARPWLGFVGAWFLLILAPTSTIIPIRDPLVEHRMYLPLAAVLLLVVLGAFHAVEWLIGADAWRRKAIARTGLAIALGLAGALAYATSQRNHAYQSDTTIWRDVVSKRPDNARGHLKYGAGVGDLGEAERAFRRAIELRPDYADAHYNLGLVHNARGELSKAIDAYRRAVDHNPKHAQAQYNLANALSRRGEGDAAVEAYMKAIDADPQHDNAQFNLGIALHERGDLDGAAARYRAVLRINPEFGRAMRNLGHVLLAQGRKDDASAQFGAALRRGSTQQDPELVADLCCDLGRIYIDQGELTRAAQLYTEGLAIHPRHPELYFGLGEAFAKLDKPELARTALQECLRFKPRHVRARQALQMLQSQSESNDE